MPNIDTNTENVLDTHRCLTINTCRQTSRRLKKWVDHSALNDNGSFCWTVGGNSTVQGQQLQRPVVSYKAQCLINLHHQLTEERRVFDEEERKASEEYIQRLLAEEEQLLQAEQRRREDDERMARLLSDQLVGVLKTKEMYKLFWCSVQCLDLQKIENCICGLFFFFAALLFFITCFISSLNQKTSCHARPSELCPCHSRKLQEEGGGDCRADREVGWIFAANK